jgi:hypothetical protein
MERSEPVSDAVNSTYPPATIRCCDTAPLSPQPPHPPVFVTLLPFAVVLMSVDH